MRYFSLNTWSLHRNLGPLRWTVWDDELGTHKTAVQDQPETVSLLELPGVLASKGFSALEICHFHFPDKSMEYAERLKQSFERAGMRFYSLLIDYGDISSANPIRREADMELIRSWIDIASLAGAERVRVVAGESDPSDRAALTRSIEALNSLCDYAVSRNVRVVTENFGALSSTRDNCLALLEECGGKVGFISDFGNAKGASKYDFLEAIVPTSESIHAKPHFNEQGMPDASEFERCLKIMERAAYEGPIVIIYDGPGDMWEGIDRVKSLAEPYLAK